MIEYWQNVTNDDLFSKVPNCSVPVGIPQHTIYQDA